MLTTGGLPGPRKRATLHGGFEGTGDPPSVKESVEAVGKLDLVPLDLALYLPISLKREIEKYAALQVISALDQG